MTKILLCIGHLSPFGATFLREIVNIDRFQVKAVLIADLSLYLRFTRKLKQSDQLESEKSFRRNYKKETRALLTFLREHIPQAALYFCSEITEKTVVNLFQKHELVFSAAFPAIFTAELLAIPVRGTVNFHPSYLPRCRGAHPVYWTIASGEPFGGLSAHLMTTRIDAGPIIVRKKINFDPESVTYEELYQMVLETIKPVLTKTADFFEKGLIPENQDEDRKTYFRENLAIHQKIHWNKESAGRISAKIRAGGAFAFYRGEKIWLTAILNMKEKTPFVTNHYDHLLEAGTIAKVQASTIWVRTLDQYIKVRFHRRKTVEHVLISRLESVGLLRLTPRFAFLQNRIIEIGEILQ